MLLRFSVSNYLSFSEECEFNVISTPSKELTNHVIDLVDVPNGVLKTSIVYGANGSGKSNLIVALKFLQSLVRDGRRIKQIMGIRPFKFKEKENQPTTFEVVFVVNDRMYTYFIKLSKTVVLEETLYVTEKGKDILVFERYTKGGKSSLQFGQIVFPDKVGGEKSQMRLQLMESELRNNQPFLFEGANKSVPTITAAHSWFDEKLDFVLNKSYQRELTSKLYGDAKFRADFNSLTKALGLGIENVAVEEIDVPSFDTNFSLATLSRRGKIMHFIDKDGEHRAGKIVVERKSQDGVKVQFNLVEESQGTKRIFAIIPSLIAVMNKDAVYFIDEIEKSLHPILVKKMLKWLLSEKHNFKGQLFLSSHESTLLDRDLFREDEIWFMEKDANCQSHLTSLFDYKNAGHDCSVANNYLQGKYGAIPFMGSLEELGWKD